MSVFSDFSGKLDENIYELIFMLGWIVKELILEL